MNSRQADSSLATDSSVMAVVLPHRPHRARRSTYHMCALNVFEAEELLRLCRGGRLYEVEKRIASGRSLAMPAGTRNTPLGITIDMGFHRLADRKTMPCDRQCARKAGNMSTIRGSDDPYVLRASYQ